MSKYVHDFRPRFDDLTNDKIERLAAAYGLKPNVLLRQLIESSVRMIEFVQRHPEPLHGFDFNEVAPETVLWTASQARLEMKDKAKTRNNEVA